MDDEIPFVANLLKLLSRRGYEVSAVHDGDSALRVVQEIEQVPGAVNHRQDAVAQVLRDVGQRRRRHETPRRDPVEPQTVAPLDAPQRREKFVLGDVNTSLIKTALAIHHGVLPPTLHCERPNPWFDFRDSPFYPVTTLQDWGARDRGRRAGISSFGFGGTNAHAIVAEPGPATEATAVRPRLPPLRFDAAGSPGFYASWLRPAVFASALVTDPGSDQYRAEAYNLGVQLDLQLQVMHRLPMMLSVGYAHGFEGNGLGQDEWMVSFKVL